MSNKKWVYHATEDAKIVSGEEAEELYKQGWADSPAAFKGPEGDDPTEEVDEPEDDEPEVTDKEVDGPEDEDPKPERQLSQMNVADLTALAMSEGLVVEPGATKAEIRNLIVKHRNEE